MAKAISGNNIVIVGAGHMGTALKEGLVRGGVGVSSIVLIKKNDNVSAVSKTGIVFIAVKPSAVPEALAGMEHLLKGKTVVSLAAAVPLKSLERMLKHSGATVVRIMPNMPVAVGEGIIGMYGKISGEKKSRLLKILSGLGAVVEVKSEKVLDALTLIAGCGPGFVSYFIDMLAQYAKKQGFSEMEAQTLSLQVFKGTYAYLESKKLLPAELVGSVATKGGVTENIIKTLDKKGLRKSFAAAMDAGKKKIHHVQKNRR